MTNTLLKTQLAKPDVQTALRTMRILVTCYTVLSLATFVAIFLLRDRTELVTTTVWVRGTIVAITSIIMLSLAVRTTRGANRAYLRLRIVSGIMLVAIAVIIALPGELPPWMKVEQGACGLLLIGVVAVINGRRIRTAFARSTGAHMRG